MSFLRIGTPHRKVRPPRGGPPCTEPYVTGTNILTDPGFELHLANTGGGPLGDEIPTDGATYRGEWTDSTEAPSVSGWMADWNFDNDPGVDRRWWIETANPHSGTYHARYPEAAGASTTLWPVSVDICNWPSSDYPRAGGVVTPGDYVKWSAYLSVTSTTGSPKIVYGITWLDANGDYVSEISSGSVDPTTSYVQYTMDGFAPTGVAFALPFIGRTIAGGTPPDTTYYDVDTCSLEIS